MIYLEYFKIAMVMVTVDIRDPGVTWIVQITELATNLRFIFTVKLREGVLTALVDWGGKNCCLCKYPSLIEVSSLL